MTKLITTATGVPIPVDSNGALVQFPANTAKVEFHVRQGKTGAGVWWCLGGPTLSYKAGDPAFKYLGNNGAVDRTLAAGQTHCLFVTNVGMTNIVDPEYTPAVAGGGSTGGGTGTGTGGGGTGTGTGTLPPSTSARDPSVNDMGIRNVSPADVLDWPMSIARFFKRGEIKNTAGILGFAAVGDTKMRWDDGSVKHAIFRVIMPKLAKGVTGTLLFMNVAAVSAAPLTAAQMLATNFNFDAQIQLSGNGGTASARQMLQDGSYTVWTSSVDATEIILADHSAARKYDIGPNALRSIRPIFHATFWPGINKVRVRYIGENCNTETLEDVGFDDNGLTSDLAASDIASVVAIPQGTQFRVFNNGLNDVWVRPGPDASVKATSADLKIQSAESAILTRGSNAFLSAITKVGQATTLDLDGGEPNCNLTLSIGHASPKQVYAKASHLHFAATKWTKTFWIGGAPEPAVDIDHNIGYVSSTGALPTFDHTLRIPEASIDKTYKAWLSKRRDLGDNGGLQTGMGVAGGRDEIYVVPRQQAQWLLSGDHRLLEVASGLADLAGSFPGHVREGDPTKFFDAAKTVPAIGKPLSVFARPSLWLFDRRDKSTPQDAVPIQGVRVTPGRHPAGGWSFENTHQPDMYSALYALTGDYFYLEQLQIWVASTALIFSPGNRGPQFSMGFYTEVRGFAWTLLHRIRAAYFSPDGSPEKVLFTQAAKDGVAFAEGSHDVRGTPNENTPIWAFARKAHLVHNLLHFFDENHVNATATHVDPKKLSLANSQWMCHFIIFALGEALEKGFTFAQPLFSWCAWLLITQFQEPGYNPMNVWQYVTGLSDQNGVYFKNWTETVPAYAVNPPPLNTDVGNGFSAIAYGASTMVTKEPGGQKAYDWCKANIYDKLRARYPDDPKWALLARA